MGILIRRWDVRFRTNREHFSHGTGKTNEPKAAFGPSLMWAIVKNAPGHRKERSGPSYCDDRIV